LKRYTTTRATGLGVTKSIISSFYALPDFDGDVNLWFIALLVGLGR
jgi:hypothetical protein